MATVEMHLANLNLSHKRMTAQQSYAFMSSSRYVLFKTGLLLDMKPELALTFMVHEFTSHRFDKNYAHLDGEEKDILEHRGHYGGKGHPFEATAHCATDRKSKTDANAIGCMNGFIDKGYANFINALPFFKKWYDDHSSDPLTMFDLTNVKPSTTPPKKEKVKKLPPAPPVTPPVTPPTTITFKAPPVCSSNSKIPESADIDPGGSMNYELKVGWYYPVGAVIPKGESTVMPDGERVEYKFHIALDPATYMSGANPSRDIVSTFLLKNNIAHKCAGTKHLSDSVFTGGKQYGKMFTVYPATLDEFYIIAKGIQELVKKYFYKESLRQNSRHKARQCNTKKLFAIPITRFTILQKW